VRALLIALGGLAGLVPVLVAALYVAVLRELASVAERHDSSELR
jgi:hypothetical protein